MISWRETRPFDFILLIASVALTFFAFMGAIYVLTFYFQAVRGYTPLRAGMLYVAIATRAFRRYSTYRAATLAGIFTNSVFGIIYSFAYLALWDANPGAGGYDKGDAVTYVWLGQALLMTVALWGGGTTDDLAERIRNGRMSGELLRPVTP